MPTNSGRAIEVFTEAIQLPAEERAAFLDLACGEDQNLRRMIEALLKSNDRIGDFLEQPAAGETAGERASAVVGEKPGDQVDRYRLIQQIGEGGCGVVFVAEQEQPVRRRVALKVVKPGMDTNSVIARFEAERQALALMDHANIAHVFDAGATASGRPYFVMELIEGVKITEYCDRHSLLIPARLKLFVQVCDAIQHAHQKGIIHRDIKPSNILVTTGADGKPVPKVIDFGIAKATADQQLTDKTIFTAFEMLIGTPAYMSPEQAALTSNDVDTRTDIYSLGVLLYELLTGTTPFDTRELLKAGFDEVRRVIRDEEPVRPSTRVSTMVDADLADISKHYGAEAPKLIREMLGDLDWIVMKALEKDRARRYATTNGLAMDIERYLSGEAVLARPPSVIYKFRKLFLRNRLLFGALSMVGATFVIAFVAVAVALTREKVARREADKALREAESDRTNSNQVTVFLEAMLEGVGPNVALGRDTTVLKAVLDQTAARLAVELTNQPAVQAELRSMLGRVYDDIRQYKESEAMFREALATRTRLFGEESEAASDSMLDLGNMLSLQSRESEGESYLRRALAVRQKLFGEKHIKVAECYEGLGAIFWRRRQLPETEAILLKSLTIRRRLLGDGSPELGDSLVGLGSVQYAQGKHREAGELYQQAIDNWKRVLDEDHPSIVLSMQNLAAALFEQGKHAEAEELLRNALATRRKVHGEEHPLVVDSLRNLTGMLNRLQRFDEAEATGREAIVMARKVWGDTRSETLAVLRELLRPLLHLSKFEEVEQLFGELLPPEQQLKPEHVSLLMKKCDAYARRGRWREATADATVLLRVSPEDHEKYHTLAPLLAQLGDVVQYQRLCQTILAKFSETTDIFIADRMAKDCLILPSSGSDLTQVVALADLAVNRGSNLPGAPNFRFCKGLAEFRMGRYEEAIKWAGLAAAGPFSHPKACAFAVMAMSRFKLNQLDEARTALSECNKVIDEKLPKAETGDFGNDWRDWIIARALQSEAKRMIEGESPSAAHPTNVPR
jgi:eukaryotic-like serine/threonine-protein kinase